MLDRRRSFDRHDLSDVGMLGNVFSPIAGVLIADYLFIQHMRIDLVALFEANSSYWY